MTGGYDYGIKEVAILSLAKIWGHKSRLLLSTV